MLCGQLIIHLSPSYWCRLFLHGVQHNFNVCTCTDVGEANLAFFDVGRFITEGRTIADRYASTLWITLDSRTVGDHLTAFVRLVVVDYLWFMIARCIVARVCRRKWLIDLQLVIDWNKTIKILFATSLGRIWKNQTGRKTDFESDIFTCIQVELLQLI